MAWTLLWVPVTGGCASAAWQQELEQLPGFQKAGPWHWCKTISGPWEVWPSLGFICSVPCLGVLPRGAPCRACCVCCWNCIKWFLAWQSPGVPSARDSALGYPAPFCFPSSPAAQGLGLQSWPGTGSSGTAVTGLSKRPGRSYFRESIRTRLLLWKEIKFWISQCFMSSLDDQLNSPQDSSEQSWSFII